MRQYSFGDKPKIVIGSAEILPAALETNGGLYSLHGFDTVKLLMWESINIPERKLLKLMDVGTRNRTTMMVFDSDMIQFFKGGHISPALKNNMPCLQTWWNMVLNGHCCTYVLH